MTPDKRTCGQCKWWLGRRDSPVLGECNYEVPQWAMEYGEGKPPWFVRGDDAHTANDCDCFKEIATMGEMAGSIGMDGRDCECRSWRARQYKEVLERRVAELEKTVATLVEAINRAAEGER